MWMGIGIDKLQHMIAGFVAISVTLIWLPAKHASIISIAIAVGKEAYDAPTAGDADLMDFLSTIIGIVIGLLIALIIKVTWNILVKFWKVARQKTSGKRL